MTTPTCGAPCPYGGLSATRKYSNVDFGWMGRCNRRVSFEGARCWQHDDGTLSPERSRRVRERGDALARARAEAAVASRSYVIGSVR